MEKMVFQCTLLSGDLVKTIAVLILYTADNSALC